MRSLFWLANKNWTQELPSNISLSSKKPFYINTRISKSWHFHSVPVAFLTSLLRNLSLFVKIFDLSSQPTMADFLADKNKPKCKSCASLCHLPLYRCRRQVFLCRQQRRKCVYLFIMSINIVIDGGNGESTSRTSISITASGLWRDLYLPLAGRLSEATVLPFWDPFWEVLRAFCRVYSLNRNV